MYLLIIIGTFLEGELVLIGLSLAQYLEWIVLDNTMVCITASLGAWLGDWAWYEIGRRRGFSFVERWPRTKKVLDGTSRFLARYPMLTILALRFQIACRSLGNLCLGRADIPRARYLWVNAVACILWGLAIPPLCRWFVALMGSLYGGI